jgi:hypothetical protein
MDSKFKSPKRNLEPDVTVDSLRGPNIAHFGELEVNRRAGPRLSHGFSKGKINDKNYNSSVQFESPQVDEVSPGDYRQFSPSTDKEEREVRN